MIGRSLGAFYSPAGASQRNPRIRWAHSVRTREAGGISMPRGGSPGSSMPFEGPGARCTQGLLRIALGCDMSSLRDYANIITLKRLLVREADVGVEPGVERSGTPGIGPIMK
jgi:hypothetical protein